MKTKRYYVFLIIFFLSINIFPLISIGADDTGLVPCTTNCGFNDFMTLINTVVSFILFKLAVPIAAIMFAYAGFMLVTSGGSSEKRSKAKSIFTSVLIGLVVAIAAWLIVNTVLSILGYNGDWIGF